jgi:hypothetical protein
MLGMKMKHTTIMTMAPIIMLWIDVGRTSSNCKGKSHIYYKCPGGYQQLMSAA